MDDSDGDGFSDYPDDRGCEGDTDSSDRSPAIVCGDGVDNDGDRLADLSEDHLDAVL